MGRARFEMRDFSPKLLETVTIHRGFITRSTTFSPGPSPGPKCGTNRRPDRPSCPYHPETRFCHSRSKNAVTNYPKPPEMNLLHIDPRIYKHISFPWKQKFFFLLQFFSYIKHILLVLRCWCECLLRYIYILSLHFITAGSVWYLNLCKKIENYSFLKLSPGSLCVDYNTK